ncbi:MAG: discoidin domain-containing protein [Verrucomicrobiaceae bacterium]
MNLLRSAAIILSLNGPLTATAQDHILFIRGGSGTVGFFEGGADEQGASIDNFIDDQTNHGWGELATALEAEGFLLTEISEDTPSPKSPVPLDTLPLSDYALIVFGSNNAVYTTAQINAFTAYIQQGGAALFIADANFGSNWSDASSSDTQFLAPFGIESNQDQGTYQVRRADSDFLLPNHPVFTGVSSFDGEGVSPGLLNPSLATLTGVTRTILARVPSGKSLTRNPSPLFSGNRGPSQTATSSDGTLITASYGSGKIALHFDRNTFFNLGGAGTNINRFQNERYARNLFNWLAGKPDFNPATDNAPPRAHLQNLAPEIALTANGSLNLTAKASDPDGSITSVQLLVDGQPIATDSTSPYQFTLPNPGFGTRTLTLRTTDNDGATTDNQRTLLLTDPGNLPSPLDRSNWTLTSSVNNGSELANAIDGNLSSRWPSRQFQTPGQTLNIDLSQPQLFQTIVLETPANPNDYPRGYLLSGSNDGTTFTQLAVDPSTPNNATTTITLDRPRHFRFLRIEQTGSSSNRWWSIHELNILSPAPGDPLPLASWQELHNISDLSIDPDLDGQNNLLEFAFHTDPHDKSSAHRPAFHQSAGSLTFSHRRWTGNNGVDYLIQTSPDLTTWTPATTTPLGTPTPLGNGAELATFQISPPPGSTPFFVRLRATIP